jgi:hypothetical protein
MSYLESLTLAKTIPCMAEPGKIIVVGKPSRLLDEVKLCCFTNDFNNVACSFLDISQKST